MDLPTLNTTELLRPLLAQAPPWLVLAVLAGLVGAAAFFLFVGRGFRSLPTYLLFGALIAPLIQIAGSSLSLGPGPLTVGEVDLVALTLGTWLLLGIARLLRL